MVWKELFGRKDKVEQQSPAPNPAQEGESEVSDLVDETVEDELDDESARSGFFTRLKSGLSKTRQGFVGKVEALVKGRGIDDELFEELEEIMIQADVGFPTTMHLVDRLRERVRVENITEGIQMQTMLQEEIVDLLEDNCESLTLLGPPPAAIMVVGVNGAGKTTTIGKLAYRLKSEQATVLLGAGDTFRAAAIDQLQVWADRVGVDIIAHNEGSDPGAVAFDTVAAAKARKSDVLILDTAGRLQTKTNLMAELSKVYRIVTRELGRDPDEILLVVDATTGQNAMSQAKLFSEAVPVSGIILTKLDGTAKGGIILALSHELKLPVKLIGIGEKYTDLQDFDAKEFARALFS